MAALEVVKKRLDEVVALDLPCLERLEARPQAERTIDAQERWEHLQKQMGD